jgi:hypothetical protein
MPPSPQRRQAAGGYRPSRSVALRGDLWLTMARRKREEVAAGAPDWETAVAFLVTFERRQVKDLLERRLVAEQVEPAREQTVSSWPDWDSGQIGDWLQKRVNRAEATPGAMSGRGEEAAGGGEAPTPSPRRAQTAQLSIQRVVIADPTGRVEVVSEGRPTAEAVACTTAGSLQVSVVGAAPDHLVLVALRLGGGGGMPRGNASDPVALPREGPAEVEVSAVGLGAHLARVVAWAPDGSTAPDAVELGTLTIHPVG